MAGSKEECALGENGPCSGDISHHKCFYDNNAQKYLWEEGHWLCEKHWDDHIAICALANNGFDIDEILTKNAKWRKQQYLILKLSGVIKDTDINE